MNLKKWEVAKLDKEHAAGLAEQYNIPFFLAMMLDIRGYRADEQIEELLYEQAHLADPYEMKDMDKAVSRIRQALDGFQKIAVYGDYDADGVTATAMLFSYLETVGADVIYYIPKREGEGYGMNENAVRFLHGEGVQLIITVDNGISSVNEVALANSLGMDVVITDHHRPHDAVPEAFAVVDAYQTDCPSHFKDLCGAGVVLKLLIALEDGDEDAVFAEYADLAALGTIGDIVSLKGENRTIIRAGLSEIASGGRPGIDALVQLSGVNAGSGLSAGTVAFTLVPRINAVGRMGEPERAVRLLTCEYPEDAERLAAEVCEENDNRRKVEAEIAAEVFAQIESDEALRYDRVLVVSGKDWHPGVIGIVAARVTDRYGKPCIIISESEQEGKGSGRSVEGFSLFEAISACGELLEKFGGHPMAAGITVLPQNIAAFREKINAYAKTHASVMPAQTIRLDCKLNPATLNVDMPAALSALEPYGSDNPAPLFGLFGMTVEDIIPLSAGAHTKLMCRRGDAVISCLKFGMKTAECPYSRGDAVDLAVELSAKEYKNQMQLTISVKDLRPSGLEMEDAIGDYRLYEKYKRGEPLSAGEAERITPGRQHLAAVYRKIMGSAGVSLSALKMQKELQGVDVNMGRLLLCFDILKERKLVSCEESGGALCFGLSETNGTKLNIYESVIFTKIKELTSV